MRLLHAVTTVLFRTVRVRLVVHFCLDPEMGPRDFAYLILGELVAWESFVPHLTVYNALLRGF